MPNAPKKDDEYNALQVPPGKSDADSEKENRSGDKTPLEPFKKRTIAIGADHSRQVMAHRTERSHEKINVLGAPARLREREHGKKQKRRAYVKDQVAPTAQDPEILAGRLDRNGRDGLRLGKGA